MINPAQKCYSMARDRCVNPNSISYKNYGARGIEFRFSSFKEFLQSIGERPSKQHTLNRINNDGHYEVGNVEWTTWDKQVVSRRKPKNTFGITGVHQKFGRSSYIAYSNNKALYIGPDFFEACCKRKSWELQK